jgi:hypothetical protein
MRCNKDLVYAARKEAWTQTKVHQDHQENPRVEMLRRCNDRRNTESRYIWELPELRSRVTTDEPGAIDTQFIGCLIRQGLCGGKMMLRTVPSTAKSVPTQGVGTSKKKPQVTPAKAKVQNVASS